MRGILRLIASVGAVLAALVSLTVLPNASAAPGAAAQSDPAPSNIRIVQTPSGGGGICLPPALALRQSTRSDASTFRLIIRVTAPLCARVNAVAAIYRMPGNGVAWPQTLLETAPFTLREPGVTEVIFTKTCTPVQFDVITGATPPVISPLGPFHGPLLFPFDTSTSLQWFGCPTTSTSTTSTTSSTTTTTIDDNCENYTPGNVTVTPSSAEAGATLTVQGTGTPGTLVQVLLKPPTQPGPATERLTAAEESAGFVALSNPALVQPDGTWSTTLIVPSDAQPGVWVVAANAVDCETVVTTEVTIVGNAVVPTAPSTSGPVVAGEVQSNTIAASAAGAGAAGAEVAAGQQPSAAGLAFTGSAAHLPIVAGVVLLTAGGLILLSSRRRRPT